MMKGVVVWLTGLPCSGKSTLAEALVAHLAEYGQPCALLDGDAVRPHLSGELGFSREHRDINVHRIGYVAGLLASHGVPTVVAAVSPYRGARDHVRRTVPRFVEVFVDCPLDVCEQRDVKGMYAEARAGKRLRFTGVDDPYEAPLSPEVTLLTYETDVWRGVMTIARELRSLGYWEPPQLSKS